MDEFSESRLRKAIAATRSGEDDLGVWTHKNGRKFGIEWTGVSNQHLLTEYAPTQRVSIKSFMKDGSTVIYFTDDHSISAKYNEDPNGLSLYVQDRHGPTAEAVRGYPAIDPRRMGSLAEDEIVSSISECITNNRRLIPPILALDLSFTRMKELAEAENASLSEMEDAASQECLSDSIPVLFRGLCDRNGPLRKEQRALILAHLNTPSAQTWDAVARITITKTIRFHSAWSAWEQLFPEDAQRYLLNGGPWEAYPDRETFLLILESARDASLSLAHAGRVSPEDVLRSTIKRENLIRQQIGLPDLTPDQIAIAMGDEEAWSNSNPNWIDRTRKSVER